VQPKKQRTYPAADASDSDQPTNGGAMNDETFNLTIRQFLKRYGITAQREIERAVRAGLEAGTLNGTEILPVRATLAVPGVLEEMVIEGEVKLG
jgi:hypothetical protein